MAPPVAIIALDGMQSQRLAAPPTTSRSISVTSTPSRAAWVAAWFPAGPPPMITNLMLTGYGRNRGPVESQLDPQFELQLVARWSPCRRQRPSAPSATGATDPPRAVRDPWATRDCRRRRPWRRAVLHSSSSETHSSPAAGRPGPAQSGPGARPGARPGSVLTPAPTRPDAGRRGRPRPDAGRPCPDAGPDPRARPPGRENPR